MMETLYYINQLQYQVIIKDPENMYTCSILCLSTCPCKLETLYNCVTAIVTAMGGVSACGL